MSSSYFEESILNDIVEALVEVKAKAAAQAAAQAADTTTSAVLLPLLAIPKRRRSRMITLEGMRAAFKAKAFSSFNNGGCGGGKMVSPKVKKEPTAAVNIRKKRSIAMAAKKIDSDAPKYEIHQVAPLKLTITRVKHSETHNVDHGGQLKRKIDDHGLAEDNISNAKKTKLMSESLQPEPMIIASLKSSSSSAQELPSTKCTKSNLLFC